MLIAPQPHKKENKYKIGKIALLRRAKGYSKSMHPTLEIGNFRVIKQNVKRKSVDFIWYFATFHGIHKADTVQSSVFLP